MQFTGSWTFVNVSTAVPGGKSYHMTQMSGDQAQYTFKGEVSFYKLQRIGFVRCLAGQKGNKMTTFVAGSSVELMGLTNASSGLFNVSLSSSNGSSITNTYQLSGLSSLLSPTTLFYACGLNDTATHMLTITNVENKTLVIDGLNVSVVTGGKRYV